MITPERDPADLATASCLEEGDRFVWNGRTWFVEELDERFAHVELVDLDGRESHECAGLDSNQGLVDGTDLCYHYITNAFEKACKGNDTVESQMPSCSLLHDFLWI